MAKRQSTIASQFERLISDVVKTPRQPSRGRARGGARPINPHLEKFQQHDGCKLLSSLGAAVYTIGTRRSKGKPCPKCKTFVPEDQGTRQTPGIFDVLAFLPARNGKPVVALWWDAKHADGGRVSPEQKEFAELCRLASQAHCIGPYDVLFAWLMEHEYLRADRVPHYRLPKAVQP